MYLSRSLSQRLKFSRTLCDCSSWVRMAGGIRPCIPRICLSLRVKPNSCYRKIHCRKIERKNKQMSSMGGGGVGGQAVYLHPTLFLIHVLILQTSTWSIIKIWSVASEINHVSPVSCLIYYIGNWQISLVHQWTATTLIKFVIQISLH